MTTPDTLDALAVRCEQATGADRDIDGFIHAHLTRGEPYVIGHEPGRFPQRPVIGERLDVMEQIGGSDGADYVAAPADTASLDAAKQLVPEGCNLNVWTHRSEKLRAGAGVARNSDGKGACVYSAATPALALCAAALRVRADAIRNPVS